MLDKKVLFLDLDGTLTNDEKKVTPKTLEALKKIMEEGHIVALASGRPTPGIFKVAETLELEKYGGYVLSFNGGKVINWKTKEVIYENSVSKEYVPELVDYALENNIGLITYDDESIVVGTPIDKYIELEAFINSLPLNQKDMKEYVTYNPSKCLFTAEDKIAAEHEKILAKKFEGRLSVYRSEPFFIEALPIGIDKARSMERLINHLGIPKENTIACGDGYNDLTMIKYAHIGVAMENAADVVKENADYITKSNNDDGIAHVIEKYIL